MDGLTQGLIGATAAGAALGNRMGRLAYGVGFVGGILADADYLIRIPGDPLYTTVFHRGFSHSLIFIPIGGLLAALPFLAFRRHRPAWRLIVLAAVLGYATHGLLDACTTYGTQLYWPFSDQRVAWNLISVVDLFFSVPLLVAVILGWRRRAARPARWALAWAAVYLAFCGLQHTRVHRAQDRLAESRGHVIDARIIAPIPLAAVLYRSVYLDGDGVMHADSVRAGFFGGTTVRPGTSLATVEPEVDAIIAAARYPREMRRDLARYRWFTAGFWARSPPGADRIGDMRITRDPASFTPLWGIELDFEQRPAARPVSLGGDFPVGALLREMLGLDRRHRPLGEVADRAAATPL
jgi:inner membrane protein